MSRFTRLVSLSILLNIAGRSGFPQLRYPSPYSVDRINTDQTCFVLKDPATASFRWVSEWTQMTVQAYEENPNRAIFLWYFKDGTKAYSTNTDNIGDAGKLTAYQLANEASNLEGIKRNKIQPLTLTNYPVRIELWVGEAEDPTGFKPGTLIGAACFNAQGIEYGRTYHFTVCDPGEPIP
jgi:hypothetical protein